MTFHHDDGAWLVELCVDSSRCISQRETGAGTETAVVTRSMQTAESAFAPVPNTILTAPRSHWFGAAHVALQSPTSGRRSRFGDWRASPSDIRAGSGARAAQPGQRHAAFRPDLSDRRAGRWLDPGRRRRGVRLNF